MKKPDNLPVLLDELKSFSAYLNSIIEDGSFYRLSFSERHRHIKHIKQLYNQLRGPVTDIKLKHILAGAALLAFVVPIKIGPAHNVAPASLLMGCSFNNPDTSQPSVLAQLTVPRGLAAMQRLELTITGPEMTTIEESFSGGETSITVEVPAGKNRTFTLLAVVDPAVRSGIMQYIGESTVDLEAGDEVEITLNMAPDPIEPSFAAPVQNPFGLGGTFYRFVNPSLVDLDADGDLDLLVSGYEEYGPDYHSLFWYENTGSSQSPSFETPVKGPFGIPGSADGGINRGSFLDITDLDDDGDFDIIEGNDSSYGEHFFYWQNTGTNTTPSFASHPDNPNPFGLSPLNYSVVPNFGDLDGDGDTDLLVGDYEDGLSRIYYFENSGTKSSPAFTSPVQSPFGISSIPSRPIPKLVDLDGDDDLDIVVGDRDGNLHYFENSGSATSPSFADPVQNSFGLINTITYGNSVPAFGDIDGDGDLDLLVGEYATNIWYFENKAR